MSEKYNCDLVVYGYTEAVNQFLNALKTSSELQTLRQFVKPIENLVSVFMTPDGPVQSVDGERKKIKSLKRTKFVHFSYRTIGEPDSLIADLPSAFDALEFVAARETDRRPHGLTFSWSSGKPRQFKEVVCEREFEVDNNGKIKRPFFVSPDFELGLRNDQDLQRALAMMNVQVFPLGLWSEISIDELNSLSP